MIDIKHLTSMYFASEKEVPYILKCGVEIKIYPILVEDWALFESSYDILRIEKNELNNEEVLQMSYFQFILTLIDNDKEGIVTNKITTTLGLSLKEDRFSFDEVINGKRVISIVDENKKIKYYIDKKDFEDIKKIILHCNLIDYSDRYIDPELRRALAKKRELESKGRTSPTFEAQKVFVISKTGMSMQDVNKMTYRTFSQVYKFNVASDLYVIRNMMKASEKYEVKEEIIHPLFDKEKSELEELFVDADSFTKQFNNV